LAKLDSQRFTTASPVTANTVFPIGSLSNIFVALCVSKLVHARALSYTDTVGKFFPNIKPDSIARECTLRRLLSHTSGIAEIQGLGEFSRNAIGWKHRSKTFSERYENGVMRMHTGTRTFMKALHNYGILCAVLEKIHGSCVEEIITKELLYPLKMYSTFVGHHAPPTVSEDVKADLFTMTRIGKS
jgi:CubicO group peptidase (beta-lactamase class C family)